MNSSTFIPVGVDIAKNKFDVARLEDGKYRHKVFENTPLGFAAFQTWLSSFGPAPVRIAMEATGAYSVPLAEFLAARGFWVSVVNPAQIKAFAQSELSRAKTDPADAKLIARFTRERRPPRCLRSMNCRRCCAGSSRCSKCGRWSGIAWLPPTPPPEPRWRP
jgi:transposase